MNRQLLLGVLAIALLVLALWVPARALLFGGPLGGGASGEWVGTMTITGGYPISATPSPFSVPLPAPRKAAVYLKLSLTDSFLREYGGPGELHIAGEQSSIPFRLAGFRIGSTPGTNMISDRFVTANLSHCTFKPSAIHLENQGFPGMKSDQTSFTVDLHPGTKAQYESLFGGLQSQSHPNLTTASKLLQPTLK